jgi:UDP-2,3-diacylglucosamine hydrolase
MWNAMGQPDFEPTLEDTPLAIICGGGSLPFAVADAVRRRGRRVVLFPLHRVADADAVAPFPHHWLHIGQAGRFRRLARAEGCRDVVLIGNIVRPALRHLRFDWLTVLLLPKIPGLFRGGDNHLLSGLAGLFEAHQFRVIAAHELVPDILVRAGPLGIHRPSSRNIADIEHGLALIAAIGRFDVGQAVVVAANRVLAIEAADGTDRMLKHIAALRRDGRISLTHGEGVLVKATKPSQDRRFDLPSIGPGTIEAAARAGLAGVAVLAGQTVIAEPARVTETANSAGLFVFGIRTSKSSGQP